MTRAVRQAMALTPELVALTLRPEHDRPSPFTKNEPDDIAEAADRLLHGHHGPVWAFAYGSLLWKPCFEPVETRFATAHGWHRAFNLRLRGFRATPEQEGLMMGLARGGRCSGLLLKAADHERHQVVCRLIERELPMREFLGMARWTDIETPQGRERALIFWAGRFAPLDATGLPLAEAARMIATACGHAGSCAEYLHETVTALRQHGIDDRNLWRLQAMVADEIKRQWAGRIAAAPADQAAR